MEIEYVEGLESPVLQAPMWMATTRPEWDQTYLMMVVAMSLRGECTKRKIAALIVGPGNKIITGGVNGVAPGERSCLDGACPRSGTGAPAGSSYDTGPFACISAHAEANAFLRADWEAMQGGTIYISDAPCGGCLKQIKASGLKTLIFLKDGSICIQNVSSIDIAQALAN